MKKKNLLVIVTIIEIILLFLFVIISYMMIGRAINSFIQLFTGYWINTKEATLSNSDKLFFSLESIIPIAFLIILIIRFILSNKNSKIAIIITVIFAIFAFAIQGNSSVIGNSALLVPLISYVISHILNFNGNTDK